LPCLLFRGSYPAVSWGRMRSRLLFALALLVVAGLCAGPRPLHASSAWGQDALRQDHARVQAPDIVFQGKFVCSLVRRVILPFQGTFREVRASIGQAVAEGEILARYDLSRDTLAQLRRRAGSSQIGELRIREAQTERAIAAMGPRQRELDRLSSENMAPATAAAQGKRELALLGQELTAIRERMRQEKTLSEEELALLSHQLSVPVTAAQVPATASLLAPIRGHVIWVHPDTRKGAEQAAGTPAFNVGLMDPMLFKAHIHEIEAMRLSLGDRAEITLESLPEEKLEGVISRISWTSVTPNLDQPSFYEVELTVPNPRLSIRDGLKGQAAVRKTPGR